MPLDRGPGVLQWEQDHAATPLSAETYLPPDYTRSVTLEQLADASGAPVLNVLVYDKASNQLHVLDSPPFPLSSAGGPSSPSGLLRGFDIGFPAGSSQLGGVASALGADWCGVYVGGPTYAGTWTPDMVRGLAAVLDAGFAPIYVGANVIDGALEGGSLHYLTGYQHGFDAVAKARAFGFVSGPIFLDVESPTYDAQPDWTVAYIEGWGAAVAGAGYTPGVYSSRSCLRALDGRGYATWLAAWDGNPDTEGFTIHQYRGVTTVAGAGVDLDVAFIDPSFELARLASPWPPA